MKTPREFFVYIFESETFNGNTWTERYEVCINTHKVRLFKTYFNNDLVAIKELDECNIHYNDFLKHLREFKHLLTNQYSFYK